MLHAWFFGFLTTKLARLALCALRNPLWARAIINNGGQLPEDKKLEEAV